MPSHKEEIRLRRKLSIRHRVNGTDERPRLTVFRSSKHIYAQVVDDAKAVSLAAVSSLNKDLLKGNEEKTKRELAELVGAAIAKACLARGITRVVFDRNGYIYHGRVRALADGGGGDAQHPDAQGAEGRAPSALSLRRSAPVFGRRNPRFYRRLRRSLMLLGVWAYLRPGTSTLLISALDSGRLRHILHAYHAESFIRFGPSAGRFCLWDCGARDASVFGRGRRDGRSRWKLSAAGPARFGRGRAGAETLPRRQGSQGRTRRRRAASRESRCLLH